MKSFSLGVVIHTHVVPATGEAEVGRSQSKAGPVKV
jgi:hypothetical protein